MRAAPSVVPTPSELATCVGVRYRFLLRPQLLTR
jgi:hypothetical protein